MLKTQPLDTLANQLRTGETTSLNLVNACLDRIEDTEGEGALAFLHVEPDAVRKAAVASDLMREAGIDLSPLMGIPVSVKDLFDVAGQVTRAGSKVLHHAAPATTDAAAVARLRQAGAIVIGRTNMTEFAYSGVGLNPHYGTPAAPFDRQTRRIPGGSSSGAGVSVADGMAVIGMGTDTGGSVRIPAALCGIAGFKPTARRISTQGAYPLSTTFDSIGPLAPSVACCISVDQILTRQPVQPLSAFPLNGLRLAVLDGIPLDNLGPHVARAFDRTIHKLSKAGAQITEVCVAAIENPDRPANGGRLLGSEAYAHHRAMLNTNKNLYDPRVSVRMETAAATTAADYLDLKSWRTDFINQVTRDLHPFDAFLLPTTPQIAPPLVALEQDDDIYFSMNVRMLRNTSIINQIDGCALSIPCHLEDEPPVGLMIAGLPMQDQNVLQTGLAIEAALL